ncbi:EamA family transporter, partial [Streptomyces sp. MCAF7]
MLGHYPHAGGQALRYGLACVLLLPLAGRGGQAVVRPLRALSGRQWGRLAALAAVGMVGFN